MAFKLHCRKCVLSQRKIVCNFSYSRERVHVAQCAMIRVRAYQTLHHKGLLLDDWRKYQRRSFGNSR